MKKSALAALCAASLLCAQAPPARKPAASSKPKLVVMIVVDQFRYDYLTRFRSEYTGGLKRLLDQGAVFTNAHYEHSPTVTAVGHSIVLSGAMPAASGIVGNEWLDRTTGKQVTSVSDDSTTLLGVDGKKGASPHRLLVSTFGDELKLSGKAPAKVIGLSIKDRSAIMPAGHVADGAFWFDKPSGRYVSSTFYFRQLPEWVVKFNDRKVVDQFKDGGSFEKTAEGKHGNDIVELFAEAAIEGENLGRNGGTDLLSMSFSANDTVGHAKGPHSPEAKEITLHTDKVLARFFEFVDKRLGLSNVLFVLTADHGAAPMPELMNSQRMPGGRMTEQSVLDVISKALNDKYGEAKWVIGKSGPTPYLDHKLIADSKLDLAEVQETAAQAVRAMPHIARVFTREDLRRGLALNDMVGRRVQNGFFYQRASDLFIVPEPYWLFEKSGTSHGTPWNYDTHVPIIFMGTQVKPGRYNDRAAVVDIAPTLSTLFEVEVPSGAAGRVLTEMLPK
jgi:predicted AlkP superfamily pyrophosphatase or phosphodiesterase